MKTKFLTSLLLIAIALFLVAAPAARAASYMCEEPPECATEDLFSGPSLFIGPSFAFHQKCNCVHWEL